MNTPQDIADAFNKHNIDTPEKLDEFLGPASRSAARSAADAKIAEFNEETKNLLNERAAKLEDLRAELALK